MYYMRSVLNISLPEATVRDIKREVKRGGYTSVSEYIRYVIREQQAYQLARELKQEMKEFKNGKAKKLRSLADLMD